MLESQTCAKIPPPIRGGIQTVTLLVIENTGTQLQENVKVYVNDGKYALIDRPETIYSGYCEMTLGEMDVGNLQNGDKITVCTCGARAGRRRMAESAI